MSDLLKQLWAALQAEQATALARAALRWLAGAALFVFALILFAPALGSTRFVFGTDTVSHDYVMHFYAWQRSISEAGELPLWNPYILSGLPMIGSAAICPFYPSQWLYAILPFNTAFTMQYVLALALGGIGAAWWMRCLNHRRAVCVWAGALYMVSGHFLTLAHAGHLQKVLALGWTPVALGATIQIVKLGRPGVRPSDRYRAACLLGIALGMQLLATHPQVFYATALACVLQLIGLALYAVPWKSILIGQAAPDGTTPSHALELIGRAVAMSAMALMVCGALAAVQLFPSLEMSTFSNRADGVDFQEATQTSYPPLELFEYVVPAIFGNSVKEGSLPYFGQWGERIVTDYIGLPVFLLALIGLFGSRRRYRWYLLLLFLAGTIIGLGSHTPVYWVLFNILPGFDGFRSPGTFMFLSNCALVGLSALGLDYLLNLADSVNNRGWGSALEPVAEDNADAAPETPSGRTTKFNAPATYNADETQPFNVAAVAHESLENTPSGGIDYTGTDTPPQGISLSDEPGYDGFPTDPGYDYSYTDTANPRASSNFTWESESLPWLGRPGVLVFLAAVALVSLAAAIISLAENWGVDTSIATDAERMSYHVNSRVAISAAALMCLLAGIILLRTRTWIGGLAIGLTALFFPLIHNLQYLQFDPLPPYMAHLTRQPDLQALAKSAPRPVRILEETALKTEDMLYGVSSVSGYHPIQPRAYTQIADALGFGSTEFASLFAINYTRARGQTPPAEGDWTLVEDYPDGAGGSKIWRRTQPLPYLRENAAMTTLAHSEANSAEEIASAIENDIQFNGEEAYTARVAFDDATKYRLVAGSQAVTANLLKWSPHEVRLRVNATPAREGARVLLPISDPYFPGWHAETSRAQPLPTLAVNAVQRAVALPGGERNIRFVYTPYSFRLGLFVSLFSVTLLLYYGLGTITRRLTKGQRKIRKAVRRVQTGRQPALEIPSEKGSV